MEFFNNRNFTEQNSFWDFKGRSESVDAWFLMSSPLPLAAITTTYLLYVLNIGPNGMKNKPPMQLKNVLVIYNIVQVLYSIYLVKLLSNAHHGEHWKAAKRIVRYLKATKDRNLTFTKHGQKYPGIQLLHPNGFLNSNCSMKSNLIPRITTGIYYYFLAKISELLDTVFFILRKKQNQVTFLHVYHHSAMLWTTWLSLKYDPTYTLVFVGTINSLVHVIMYSYYGLSAFPALVKYLWWKKYLTSLQLIQFVMALIHTVSNHYFGCPMTTFTLYMVLFNGTFFLYLFGDFYVKAYSRGLRPSLKQKEY